VGTEVVGVAGTAEVGGGDPPWSALNVFGPCQARSAMKGTIRMMRSFFCFASF
jgi:hypothetical protein